MKSTSMMVLVVSGIMFFSCTGTNKYLVKGTWEGGDGNWVYVYEGNASKESVAVDSVLVANGEFTVARPEVGEVITVMPGSDGFRKVIITEKEPVLVTVAKEEGKEKFSAKVEVTPEQDMVKQSLDMEMMNNLMQLSRMMALSKVKNDPIKFDSTAQVLAVFFETMEQSFENKIDSASNLMAAAFAIELMLLPGELDKAEQFYGKLSKEAKESNAGKHLATRLSELRDVNVGGMAPEIDLPAPDGNNVKLSSLRGKYVLLDFWASWCGPCLREVPNVKAIYDDYHDKGFEIYGVSLDNPGDGDKWTAAIAKHNMNWVHVSSLEGWDCPAAKRYAVTGIPKMYLLDLQGRIIAMDLRGEALREKVASLFE